jgi:hypothetical protein
VPEEAAEEEKPPVPGVKCGHQCPGQEVRKWVVAVSLARVYSVRDIADLAKYITNLPTLHLLHQENSAEEIN